MSFQYRYRGVLSRADPVALITLTEEVRETIVLYT